MVDTNTAVRAPEASNPHEACKAAVDTLARISDKWTVTALGALSEGPIRYSEIRHRIEGISQRMLTLTLYELTELGRSLFVPLHALYEWSRENRPAMLAARETFRRRGQHGSPRTRLTVTK